MCCNQSSTICGTRSACDIFLNHEERLKRFECYLSYFYSSVEHLKARVTDLQGQLYAIEQPVNTLRNTLISYLNTTVTIHTNADSVTGELLFIGDDFVELLQDSGSLVFVLLKSVIAL